MLPKTEVGKKEQVYVRTTAEEHGVSESEAKNKRTSTRGPTPPPASHPYKPFVTLSISIRAHCSLAPLLCSFLFPAPCSSSSCKKKVTFYTIGSPHARDAAGKIQHRQARLLEARKKPTTLTKPTNGKKR